MEERSISCGSVSKHWLRVKVTMGFHEEEEERRRRQSATVAAPENWDLACIVWVCVCGGV